MNRRGFIASLLATVFAPAPKALPKAESYSFAPGAMGIDGVAGGTYIPKGVVHVERGAWHYFRTEEPPLHYNCRCVVVPIVGDDTDGTAG